MEDLERVVDFFFELNSLKRVPRGGWIRIGVKNPESVAEHVLATAQIAYLLGRMEDVDAERAALIALFHDNGETRIGDLDLLQRCYLESEQGEDEAFLDQTQGLPGGEQIREFYEEFSETPEGIVARDADRLELGVQLRYYFDQGCMNQDTWQLWLEAIRNSLHTRSAQELLKEIEVTNMNQWWKNLKEIQKRVRKAR